MPKYDLILFNPPAPMARVTLRNPANGGLLSEVPMLIDSGSDITLLPQAFVSQLGAALSFEERYELEGFDGSISFTSAAQLELLFLDRVFRGKYLLFDQEWGVLGRDILNLLSLLLDGPNLSWSDQRPIKRK